jgi:hypothetical protein
LSKKPDPLSFRYRPSLTQKVSNENQLTAYGM